MTRYKWVYQSREQAEYAARFFEDWRDREHWLRHELEDEVKRLTDENMRLRLRLELDA